MWGFLTTVVAMQTYFVRELLVLFAAFAVVFATSAIVVGVLYLIITYARSRTN